MKDNTEKVDVKRQDTDATKVALTYFSRADGSGMGCWLWCNKVLPALWQGSKLADQRAAERAEQDKKSAADNLNVASKGISRPCSESEWHSRCSHAVRRINPLLIFVDYQMDGLVKKQSL